jgi:hypothetical protein
VNNFPCFSFREHLPVPDQKALAINLYYEWFEPAVDRWLDVAKFKVCLCFLPRIGELQFMRDEGIVS